MSELRDAFHIVYPGVISSSHSDVKLHNILIEILESINTLEDDKGTAFEAVSLIDLKGSLQTAETYINKRLDELYTYIRTDFGNNDYTYSKMMMYLFEALKLEKLLRCAPFKALQSDNDKHTPSLENK